MDDMPEYTIHRRKRVKYMRLEVGHDLAVKVIVPHWAAERDVQRFIKEKENWLKRALRKMGSRKQIEATGTREEYLKYKEIAREILTKKVEHWNKVYGFEYNRIAIKNLTSQWGSCSSKGNLNFNYKTIFLSEEQSDYIVVHELCHLQEMNHSHRFWKLVGKAIPEYKKIDKQVSKMILK